LLLAASILLLPANAVAVEEILDWNSHIKVNTDGSMVVTETIHVRAEGNQIKRGIYRDFPTTYQDRAGNRVVIGFNVLSVRRDGQTESYHTQDLSNGVRVYAGKSSIFLDPGEYTYDITYRTDRQLGFFENHDELYWNVTGNGWPLRILKASATVVLPQPVPAKSLMMEGYTGPQGSREQALTWEVTGAGEVRFACTRILNSKEGMTIVLGWPKGIVAEPTKGEMAKHFVSDNLSVIFSFGGLLLVSAFYGLAWVKVGKDPEKGTIIPRFTPADDLSPAAMRYVMEMGFDNRAFAAAVINLAVRGYLTITESTRALGLVRTSTLQRTGEEPSTPLSKGEQKIARELFPGSSKTLKLEKKNHKEISGAIKALKEMLEGEYQKVHFINNSGYFGIGLLLTIGILAAIGLTGDGGRGQGGGPPALFMVLWLAPWSAATFFLWSSRKFGMAAMFSFFLVMAAVSFGVATSFIFVLTIFIFIGLNILFYNLLKAPTNLGRRVMDKVDGFKMYLATAEEHRLDKLHPPDKTPELFEKYLPYALALEVDQEWSEKFADVLRRAAEVDNYSPRWYHGRHWDHMNTSQFSSSLTSSFSSAISSSSQAPGSSSGFGGGGSGGGGGGGGGGGW
jgi:uncharacterized membrane protein YgcG